MAEQTSRDERTEAATPRRREEAREKGQVAMSSEVVSATMLCAGLATLAFGGSRLAHAVGGELAHSIAQLGDKGTDEITVENGAAVIGGTLQAVLPELATFMLPLLAVGLLVGYGQVGFQVSGKAVAPTLTKIDPIAGTKRLFSARSVMRTLLAILKIVAVSGTMGALAWAQIDDVARLGPAEIGPLMVGLGHVAVRCTAGALLVILALSIVDLVFQRWQHERDLKMTKQEVKEEHKNVEGDPHVKARVRRVQREMATKRMMADVPDATVVITNPDHYAVALRYARDEKGDPLDEAPVVVAKGMDHLAQRIKQIAREAGVRCWEDVPLARTLYAKTEVGRAIPEELYAAVAVVLTYVYRAEEAAV